MLIGQTFYVSCGWFYHINYYQIIRSSENISQFRYKENCILRFDIMFLKSRENFVIQTKNKKKYVFKCKTSVIRFRLSNSLLVVGDVIIILWIPLKYHFNLSHSNAFSMCNNFLRFHKFTEKWLKRKVEIINFNIFSNIDT